MASAEWTEWEDPGPASFCVGSRLRVKSRGGRSLRTAKAIIRRLIEDGWIRTREPPELSALDEARGGHGSGPRQQRPSDRHDQINRTAIRTGVAAEKVASEVILATRVYPALLVRDAAEVADAGFGIVFPDLPGCVTQGDTPQHAAEMALEALALHVESMVRTAKPCRTRRHRMRCRTGSIPPRRRWLRICWSLSRCRGAASA